MTVLLDSLTIQDFRGVRGEQQFEFDGQNSVIVGPNGSGKSTILQAFEYLLTGDVSALSGTGTAGISKNQHLPNQYADPDDTAVRATFQTESGDSFRTAREFSSRSGLRAEDRPESLQALITAAEQGLIHLSRDELLQLVINTPGTRKDQIYQLMDTEGLDGRRKQLKRLKRTAYDEAESGETRYAENLRSIRDVAGDDVVTEIDGTLELRPAALIAAVNERRKEFGGDRISDLDDIASFCDGLTSPVEQASHPLQRDDVQQRLDRFETWLASDVTNVQSTLSDLREEIGVLRADEDTLDMLAEQSLVEQGLDIVDENTSSCPLCKRSWESKELSARLEARAERLSQVDERVERIDYLASDAREALQTVQSQLDRSIEDLSTTEVSVDITALREYAKAVEELTDRLADDLTDDPHAVHISDISLSASLNEEAQACLNELQATVSSLPDQSEMERQWSELQSLDEAYENLKLAAADRKRYARAAKELDQAHETFLTARDDVLGETLEQISDRFAEFYEAVNPDESAFDPTISQTNTGIDFSVDFYDTGSHPPHALHSEGHQDLMGVCLFLSLGAELSPLPKLPILLDDVVMSVDDEHRQHLAEVLKTELSDHFQFLITTHDTTWAHQLVESGAVREENVVRFTDWSPDRGPVVKSGLE